VDKFVNLWITASHTSGAWRPPRRHPHNRHTTSPPSGSPSTIHWCPVSFIMYEAYQIGDRGASRVSPGGGEGD